MPATLDLGSHLANRPRTRDELVAECRRIVGLGGDAERMADLLYELTGTWGVEPVPEDE